MLYLLCDVIPGQEKGKKEMEKAKKQIQSLPSY